MKDSDIPIPHKADVIDLLTRAAQITRNEQRRRVMPHKIGSNSRISQTETTAVDSLVASSIEGLTEILADVITLRDLYEKHGRQASKESFETLGRIYEKHRDEQIVLIGRLTTRIHLLGGAHLVMSADIAEITTIPRPPRNSETASAQLLRLLNALEIIIRKAQRVAAEARNIGDPRTSDMLLIDFVRIQELQSWLLAEHLAKHTDS
jgi:starvation-inducible DNA-binding protein